MARSASTTRRRIACNSGVRLDCNRPPGRTASDAAIAVLAAVLIAPLAWSPAVGTESVSIKDVSSLSLPLREEPLLAGPIDAASYHLGPGDVLVLAVPRVFAESVTLVVDAEGGIVLPGSAGRVVVAGLTLEEARSTVGKGLASLVRERAFALSLLQPRRFKVYVVGAVVQPGAYAASAVTRVSEVIERAGGIVAGGSRRNVTIQRADGAELGADLVAFSALGDRTKNPPLEGGDVVRVRAATEEMGIFGGVASPGVYEFVAGETVESAIALAGGLIPGAARDQAWLSRLGSEGRTRERADQTMALAAGDALVVPVAGDFGRIHEVEVSGEVRFPGSYPIHPGMDTVAQVLKSAGGLTAAANAAGARLLRRPAESPAGSEQSRRAAGGGALDEGGVGGGDGLVSPLATEVTPFDGEGKAQSLTFADLPPTDREVELLNLSVDGREVRIAWLEDPLADSTPLVAGDRIHIPRAPLRVRVDGRVRAPGWVAFTPGRRVDHYVELAGGYDRNANRSLVLVQRAGRSARAEQARGSEPLQDGDTIWVPEKAPRSRWGIAKDAIAFAAQVATVAIVIDRVAE